jgi:hypothetical protein
LPSDERLHQICDFLGVSDQQDRLRLMRQLQQTRVGGMDAPAALHDGAAPHRDTADADAARPRWRSATKIGIAFVLGAALIAVAYQGSLVKSSWPESRSHQAGAVRPHSTVAGTPTDPHPGRSFACRRYAVAAADLALRDVYGDPVTQLSHGEVVTVLQRNHPRGLPLWKVTTKLNQDGWVDFAYLRPACP